MFVNIIPIKTVLGKPFLNKNSESVKNADNFVNFVLSAHNKTPYGIVKRFQLVPCAILRYAQNDRFERNPVGACVKMLNLYKPRRGGLPCPPEQNPILRKTNDYAPIVGARSRLPARSVLLNILYSKVSTGDPHLGDPPKFYEISRRGQVTASPLPFCLLRRHFP